MYYNALVVIALHLWFVGATRSTSGGSRVAPDNSWEGQEGGAGVGEVTPILDGATSLPPTLGISWFNFFLALFF